MDENENSELDFNEEIDSLITLNDENGNEVKFEFLDLIEYNGEEFVVLLPTEEEAAQDEVVILKIESISDSDEESYVSVESEETLNKVFELFKEKFKEEFNFVDEEGE